MLKLRGLNRKSNQFIINDKEYLSAIYDLISHDSVQMMRDFVQHNNTSCFEHSIHVSVYSYKICKKLGLDYVSAARGGLLHDLFLYDWHTTKHNNGLHGINHPKISLHNASKYFDLNNMEKDIIVKHMFPLTLSPPRYIESYIVSLVDKYCATLEILGLINSKKYELGDY